MAKRKTSGKAGISKDDLKSSFSKRFSGEGSGLGAFFPGNLEEEMQKNPEQTVRELSSNFAMIPIGQIEANPDQPRKDFDQEALGELAESIKVHGIIQPLTVRRFSPKQYQIISGERRWRAARIAGLEEVPAYIRVANDQTLLEMALIENIQREDLNAFEIAVSYFRLKEEFTFTDEQLAERVGKKRSTVTNYLRLLDLHIEVLEAIKENRLTMGHARAIAGIKDKLLQKEVMDKILAKGLSVRESEKLARTYSHQDKIEKPSKVAAGSLTTEHQDILQDFREFFGSKRIQLILEDQESGRGHLIIPFENNEQLHQLFKMVEQ